MGHSESWIRQALKDRKKKKKFEGGDPFYRLLTSIFMLNGKGTFSLFLLLNLGFAHLFPEHFNYSLPSSGKIRQTANLSQHLPVIL